MAMVRASGTRPPGCPCPHCRTSCCGCGSGTGHPSDGQGDCMASDFLWCIQRRGSRLNLRWRRSLAPSVTKYCGSACWKQDPKTSSCPIPRALVGLLVFFVGFGLTLHPNRPTVRVVLVRLGNFSDQVWFNGRFELSDPADQADNTQACSNSPPASNLCTPGSTFRALLKLEAVNRV